MKVGSLFSGVGGFDLGLERAGMEVVWQVENDKQAQSVLKQHWPNAKVYGDVRDCTTLPPADLICGGFPCQDVSVAGNRAGLDGDRSGLWFEFHRIIGDIAPRWVLVENVCGLLSSNGGRDMGVVLRGLEQLGYGWAYRVLDSQYFGVPQRRRRVFIVGYLGDTRPAFEALFPIGTGLPGDTPKSGEADVGASAATGNSAQEDGWPQRIAPTLGYAYASKMGLENQHLRGGAGLYVPCYWDGGQLSDTLDVSMLVKGQMMPNKRRMPAVIDEKLRVRRLSPLECERLQGFPDNWTEAASNTARYRFMGNAVTVSVAEWIGHRIMETEKLA